MITELFTYLTACYKANISPEARAFGHLYESIALIQREKRCARYWLSHRTMCKNFIQDHASTIEIKNKVLIVGSGPLHEIPVEFLAKHFQQVDLVDVVHLPETKKHWSHLNNLNFITYDITELEKELLEKKRPIEKRPKGFLNENYSLVISANLLSQLAYHLRNFLEKKASPKLSENELDQFAYKVTENHFYYLKSFSCSALLITDIETHLVDKCDELIQKESPYIDFSLPVPDRTWWWAVAPIPEYSPEVAIKMKVAGFILNV